MKKKLPNGLYVINSSNIKLSESLCLGSSKIIFSLLNIVISHNFPCFSSICNFF